MSPHSHRWQMANMRPGYLVLEGCFECGARTSFFTPEPVRPIDEYREGQHFWIYQGSFQAVKFHLECPACGKRVDLDDMTALMLSTCRDAGCAVAQLNARQGEGSTVYVALCADSGHASGHCVSADGIDALNEYFNQEIEDPGRKVTVVPCKLCNNVDTCAGIIIADAGLTEIY